MNTKLDDCEILAISGMAAVGSSAAKVLFTGDTNINAGALISIFSISATACGVSNIVADISNKRKPAFNDIAITALGVVDTVLWTKISKH